MMIETQNNLFSIRRQCQILSVPRQRLYYQPCPMSEETLSVMDCIDRAFTARPVLGVAAGFGGEGLENKNDAAL